MEYKMATGQNFELPKLPSITDVVGQGEPSASTSNIFGLLKTQQGRATDALPMIQDLLIGQQGPAVQAIRQGAQMNRGAAQSDAMKRNITGSDIEAANMTAATAMGEQAVGQMIAQQASQYAQMIMQAWGMDIQANREMFVTLAQALGQELSAQRQMEQSRLDREQASNLAGNANRNALWAAGIGAAGNGAAAWAKGK